MKLNRRLLLITFIFCLIILPVAIIVAPQTQTVSTPLLNKCVVIDAGHGGRDGGSVGTTYNTIEKEINLIYAKLLKTQLENAGIKVIMTRNNSDGLYSPNVSNYKKDDMRKRKDVIQQTNPDLVISIHMNSYPRASSKGAQVFYDKGNISGQYLAKCIQDKLIYILPFARQVPSSGDYYILNSTKTPAVIVECGFLSNPQEEKLLLQPNYQELLTKAITYGVIDFFA